MKKVFIILLSIVLILSGCSKADIASNAVSTPAIHIIDDMGEEINLQQPATRIISLYSAHTENLYELGLDKEIIGVGKSDIYPPSILDKPVFDYESDPEKVIAANPDLVIIRPFINNKAPKFVKALKNAKIAVVSLYPDKFDDFEEYIKNLGALTGREKEAEKALKEFTDELNSLEAVTKNLNPKTKVYFEATETQYRTITANSMAAHAIKLAGGQNIAEDATAIREGSSIAEYGAERVLEKAEEIEVFVSQNGAMNLGGNPHSIEIRPGFNAIKAVRNGRIYNINEKLVSSPTFRFVKGVRELGRMFYPEVFDSLAKFDSDEPLTREKLAQIAVMYKHKPIFTPASSYYKEKSASHMYGDFKDVPIGDKSFDYIETAVLSGYMDSAKENFYPNNEVTREELAQTLFMLSDFNNLNKDVVIKDIEQCEKESIIRIIVENSIMELQNGCFNPDAAVTCKEMLKALEKIR